MTDKQLEELLKALGKDKKDDRKRIENLSPDESKKNTTKMILSIAHNGG